MKVTNAHGNQRIELLKLLFPYRHPCYQFHVYFPLKIIYSFSKTCSILTFQICWKGDHPNYSLLLLAFVNTQCNSETVLHWQMELLLNLFEGCKGMTTMYLTGSLLTGIYFICYTDNAAVILLHLPDLWLWRKAQGWLRAVGLLGQRLYTFKWCWYRLTFWCSPLAQSHWKVQNAALNYMWV